jgi:hypothetical protein
VAGGGEIASRQASIDDNVATWSSTLDRRRTLAVSAPPG